MTTPTASASTPAPDRPWELPAAELLVAMQVQADTGLRESDIRSRQLRYGPNELRAIGRRRSLSILADQVKSVVILLLVVAAAVSLLFGDTAEGIAILAVVIINGAIGCVTERHAIHAMARCASLDVW
ncbi:MAG: cation-transporting P-type ATPase [Woeseiaceae bacterium]